MIKNKTIAKAEEFAKLHCVDLAKEEIEMQDTALLPNGKLRELSEILHIVADRNSLKVAQNISARAALEAVISLSAQVSELEAHLRTLANFGGTLEQARELAQKGVERVEGMK